MTLCNPNIAKRVWWFEIEILNADQLETAVAGISDDMNVGNVSILA